MADTTEMLEQPTERWRPDEEEEMVQVKSRRTSGKPQIAALMVVMALVGVACGADEPAGTTEPPATTEAPATTADGAPATTAQESEPTTTSEPMEVLTLQLGIQGNFPPHNLALLAEDLGFYEDVGLDVEVIDVRASTDAAAGIIGGSIGIAVVAPDAWLPTMSGEADLVGIASTNRATIWDVVSVEGIAGWEDFAGRAVALPSETGMSTIAFILGLRDVGLDLADVEPVYAGGTSDRFAALEAGVVEVATLGVPVSYVAEDAGYVNHGPAAGEVVPMTSVNVVASREWLDGEGEEVALRWLRAMDAVAQFAQDPANFDALAAATAESMEIDLEYAERGWNDVFANDIMSLDLTYEEEGVRNVLQQFVDLGVIDAMPDDPTSLYDHSYLERARE